MKGEFGSTRVRRGDLSTEDAEGIAVEVLQRMVDDPERLGRFLSLTGLDPNSIRMAVADPGFLPAVFDFVAGDEELFLSVARELGRRPEQLEAARQRLSPEPDWSA